MRRVLTIIVGGCLVLLTMIVASVRVDRLSDALLEEKAEHAKTKLSYTALANHNFRLAEEKNRALAALAEAPIFPHVTFEHVFARPCDEPEPALDPSVRQALSLVDMMRDRMAARP